MQCGTRLGALLVLASVPGALACGPDPCTVHLQARGAMAEVTSRVQTALINAAAGSTICFDPGVYYFTEELSASTRGLTLRSTDTQVTFDFRFQRAGRQGMLITGGDFTMQDIRVRNSPADGVRVQGADRVTFRNVDVGWDAGSVSTNGEYALFPVQCNRVLVEDCEVSGASDAGIYVGQSTNIVVRNNVVYGNVAGIEIENSTGAEVYGNRAYDNTAGILVFNLPNLMVRDGRRTSVHDNVTERNNRANFARSGAIVAEVPAGLGMMLMAVDETEVFRNTIRNNDTTGLAIVSWLIIASDWERSPRFDRTYDVYPQGSWVHDNTFSANGARPVGILRAFMVGDTPIEDIVWDGYVDAMRANDPTARLCITGNAGARYRNLNAPSMFSRPSTDLGPHQCMHPPVARVTL